MSWSWYVTDRFSALLYGFFYMLDLPVGGAVRWLCKVSGVHSMQGCCNQHFPSWSSALQTYRPVLWSKPLFCLCKGNDTNRSQNIHKEKKKWSLNSCKTPYTIPVIWYRILWRGPGQATDPCCAWGFWVGIVGLGSQFTPGFRIKTSQEGGFGRLSTCWALSCKEPR